MKASDMFRLYIIINILLPLLS